MHPWKPALAIVLLATATGACLWPDAAPLHPASRARSRAVPARASSTGHATASAHEVLAGDGAAVVAHALAAIAPTVRRERAALDGRALEAELRALGAPRAKDLMALRGRLEALLRGRPELAPAAARAFLAVEDRETLFVISRALVAAGADEAVRAALVTAASPGQLGARREVALIALAGSGDPALVAIERSALDEAGAPPSVRAAAAFALARDWGALAPVDAAAVLATARHVARNDSSDHLRAEALHLIAGAGSDLGLARDVLEGGGSDELVLAAARLAVVSGEDRAHVARLLAARSDDPHAACSLAARALAP